MSHVTAADAATDLEQLLDRVEAGQEIVISRAGRPIARLVTFRSDRATRRRGARRSRVRIAHDFDELAQELGAAFKGESS
ncbi:MAG: type II toxin-antitoxin system prevent-host-death family antitoxin [Chloroflexi bacterium]|nr:MAG: type II toxin-antitoxin system prevent-host-death family antitoxin [Chloroflexota bacterium]